METKKLSSGWEWKTLQEVSTSISAGGTPRRNIQEYWNDGDIPWLKISDIKNTYVNSSEEKITKKGLENSSTKLFPKGTVLFSIFATLGEVSILNIEASTNQAIVGIIPNEKIIDRKYLYYCLKSQKKQILEKKSHATQDNLNLAILKSHKIPIPPIEIQKKIVAILDKTETLKERRNKSNEESNKITQSIFADLFGDPTKNNKKYPIEVLGDLAEKITDGTHITPNYLKEGVPFLRVTDITHSNESKKFISKEEHQELMKRCKPEKGDILYTKNGTIGIAKTIDWDYEFSIFVSLCLIKPKKNKILPKYLEVFLNTPFALSQAMQHSKKGTITNLHLIEIKKIKVPIPPISKQKEFLDIVERVERIVKYQENSTLEINNLSESLMQQAFNGGLRY